MVYGKIKYLGSPHEISLIIFLKTGIIYEKIKEQVIIICWEYILLFMVWMNLLFLNKCNKLLWFFIF